MTEPGILLVPIAAVLAPLLSRLFARWGMPVAIIVFELLLGILMGPSVLGWVEPSVLLAWLADYGVATLFFVAGTEIDFAGIKERPITRAAIGWVISLALGLGLGFLVAPGEAAVFIAVALSSTALGVLLPILRDAGMLGSPFGRAVAALGAVGEFGPLVAISIFLGSRDPGLSTLVLFVFVIIAGTAITLAFRMPQGRLYDFVRATMHTSGQFALRVVILILAALVTLSITLGIDMLMGAFAAGVIWRLVMRNAPAEERAAVESKVEAVAFGFLVPIFFVYTGVTFGLAELLADPVALLLLPVFFVMLLVVRGLPAQLCAPRGATMRDRFSLALMAATGLPIVVAVTAIGLDEGVLSKALASSLVGAGMLSVLVYPLVAMALRRHATPTGSSTDGESASPSNRAGTADGPRRADAPTDAAPGETEDSAP